MGAKLPSFQFYPGDWMKDPALRSVSVAARGLWIDMLCLMHESPRRGYLQHANGKPVTTEQIARMTGCSLEEVSQLLQELEYSGVFSCTEHGVIYSRRTVRDAQRREQAVANGRRGGNPVLVKGEDKQGVKGGVNQNSNPKITPSSSSSSSTSVNRSPPRSPPRKRGGEPIDWDAIQFQPGCDTAEVRAAISEWLEYRRQIGKRYKQPERQISLLLAEHGRNLPAAVRHSIAQGYQGCYAQKGGSGGARCKVGRGERHPADAKDRWAN